ncbi:hypothetical protein Hanom_Chr08g00730131 [Helianthus anomalus]
MTTPTKSHVICYVAYLPTKLTLSMCKMTLVPKGTLSLRKVFTYLRLYFMCKTMRLPTTLLLETARLSRRWTICTATSTKVHDQLMHHRTRLFDLIKSSFELDILLVWVCFMISYG